MLQQARRCHAARVMLDGTVPAVARPRSAQAAVLLVDTRMFQVPQVLRPTTALCAALDGTVLGLARPRSAQATVLRVATLPP